MLVLARKPNEEICIELEDGRTIMIKIIRKTTGGLWLGFKADRSIKIFRSELKKEG